MNRLEKFHIQYISTFCSINVYQPHQIATTREGHFVELFVAFEATPVSIAA